MAVELLLEQIADLQAELAETRAGLDEANRTCELVTTELAEAQRDVIEIAKAAVSDGQRMQAELAKAKALLRSATSWAGVMKKRHYAWYCDAKALLGREGGE